MHRRRPIRRLVPLLAVVVLALVFMPHCSVLMPGDSFTGPLPLVSTTQLDVAQQLRHDVEALATRIGPRNISHPEAYTAAEDFVAASLSRAGYHVEFQRFTCNDPGITYAPSNIIVEVPGEAHPGQIIVIGAHYDSCRIAPGANDNASGVAATLALARRWRDEHPERTVRFVLFANEEPPYFWTDAMGSLINARASKAKDEKIVAMLSLETIGCYSDKPDSQHYPPLVGLAYPSTANFIAFVGHTSSELLIKRCVQVFREKADFPCEGAALPSIVPRIHSSDHWSFWKQGYSSLMVTDTAPYRSADYHKVTDTAEKLDYQKMARVVDGLSMVLDALANDGGGESRPR